MKNKYYLFTIEERNGEKEYSFNITRQSLNPEETIKEIARTWYDDEDVKEDGGDYWFDCDTICVRPRDYRRLTKREFDILNKFGI